MEGYMKKYLILTLICVSCIFLACEKTIEETTEIPIVFSGEEDYSGMDSISDLVEREVEKNNEIPNTILETAIEKRTKISFEGDIKQDTGKITCVIDALDVKSYLDDHEDELIILEEKQLIDTILSAIEEEDFPRKKVSLELSAIYENGKIIVDNKSFEYEDAVLGGLYSYLTDVYSKALEEIVGG